MELGLPNNTICRQDNGGAEDVEMGKYENTYSNLYIFNFYAISFMKS